MGIKKFKMIGSGSELTSAPDTQIYYLSVDLRDQELVGQAIDDYADNELDFWAPPEAEQDSGIYGFELHSQAEPVDISNAYTSLSRLKLDYFNGQQWSISRAIALCALNGIPLPVWVANDFLYGYTNILSSPTPLNWNDVLGSPLNKGESREKYIRDSGLMPRIVYCVLEKMLAGYPIHPSTFEIISEELKTTKVEPLSIGSTKIKELYYTAKKRSYSLKHLIMLIKDKDINKIVDHEEYLASKNFDLFWFWWESALQEFKTPFPNKIPEIDI